MSYFIGILRGVENIFLSDCLQVLSLLNVGSKDISESHKSPIKMGEFSYK